MLKVLEVTANWSGPMAGAYLQALGCDVLRIESPSSPDPMRQLTRPLLPDRTPSAAGTVAPFFDQNNAGKRSIALNLKAEADLAVALRLAGESDVVIENLSPGTVERLGLGYACLSALNPGLCLLSLPSLHPGDPGSSLRGYAPAFTALGGLEARSRGDDGAPVGLLPTGYGDPNGAATGLAGLLAALVRRARTGLGAHVVTSQVKAVTYQLVRPFERLRTGSTDAPATGGGLTDVGWGRVLPTIHADQYVAAAGPADRAEDAAAAFGVAGAADLDIWSAMLEPDVIRDELHTLGLSTALVASIEDVVSSPRGRQRGIGHAVPHAELGSVIRFAVPWRLNGIAPVNLDRAPFVGEHTDEVLGSLESPVEVNP